MAYHSSVDPRVSAAVRSLIWAVTLPFVGFFVFAVLTLIPLILALFAPLQTARLILEAGFVPTLATAVLYEFVLRERSALSASILTALAAIASACTWYWWLGVDRLDVTNRATIGLVFGTVASSLLMPAYTSLLRRRRRSAEA